MRTSVAAFLALAALQLFIGVAPAQAAKADVDIVRVLEDWLSHYAQGDIDLSQRHKLSKLKGNVSQAKHFVSVQHGLISPAKADSMTFEDELRMLCEEASKRNDAAAANILLKVAGVGLEHKPVEAGLVPSVVRVIGEEFASRLTSTEAVQVLTATATGEGGKSGARQRAALRIIAKNSAGPQRALLEQMLVHAVPEVRMAAADALRIGAQPTAVAALGQRLEVEADERVAIQIVDALTATLAAAGDKAAKDDVSAALNSAIAAYGKHSWRLQIAALDFFAAARSPRTVPVLIATLARYHGKAAAPAPAGDKGSALVPMRAHAVLQSLTKCVYAQDRPDQWEEWWKENQTTLVVEAASEPLKLGRLTNFKTGTVANAFFGIPVAGSRVVFIVDISGSMVWPLVRQGQTGDDRSGTTKWEVAHAEIKGAVERLGADCTFNVIFFSSGAEGWKPKPVPATPANKKAFLTYLDNVKPEGGTNPWAGLVLAMQPKSMDPTVRVSADVDEIFLLSDGLPSVGDVIDPKHILQSVATINESSRVVINTVYIGGNEEEEARRAGARQPKWDIDGPEFMRQLATQNHGQFLQK